MCLVYCEANWILLRCDTVAIAFIITVFVCQCKNGKLTRYVTYVLKPLSCLVTRAFLKNIDAKHELHKLYHFTILGQYIAMGYVFPILWICANIDLPILPILIYLYWHNIGKSILVQNGRQHWVNIATNIDPIYAWTTVFLYCANIGRPILSQYSQTFIGPILSQILGQYCSQYWCNICMDYGFPILCQYWQTNIVPI